MALPSAPSENNSQAPDVTGVAHPARGPRVDLPSNATVRGMSRGQSRSSMMETADGNRRPLPVAALQPIRGQRLTDSPLAISVHLQK